MRAFVLSVLLWSVARLAAAQPGCVPVVLPEPDAPQTSAITHHIYYAPIPTAAERWGHISYPIHFKAPEGATSVGLMYLMAVTYKAKGWDVRDNWGYTVDGLGSPIDKAQTYVLGQSGMVYPYVPDGIEYVWYPELSVAAPGQPEPIQDFRVTIDRWDSQGIDGALSTVMQLTEAVTLGVHVHYRYPEPVRSLVSMHARVCYPVR